MPLKIISVVENRSSLIKLAALSDAIHRFAFDTIRHVVIRCRDSTVADNDDRLFNDLDLPKPDLEIESTHSTTIQQSARIMERFGNVLLEERPDVVLIDGHADSTLDCALITARVRGHEAARNSNYGPALANLCAGLHAAGPPASQEVNPMLIALLSDHLFISDAAANECLLNAGVSPEKIHLVGSLTVDTLLNHRLESRGSSSILEDLQLIDKTGTRRFVLVSLRNRIESPSEGGRLMGLVKALTDLAKSLPVIALASAGLLSQLHNAELADYFVDYASSEPWDARFRIRVAPRLGYFDFIPLLKAAALVVTDSNAVREEALLLRVPSLDLVEVVGNISFRRRVHAGVHGKGVADPAFISDLCAAKSTRKIAFTDPPDCWDGSAAERILTVLHRSRLVAASE